MEESLLETVGELVEARVQFFTRNLNGITYIQRGPALQRFLSVEENYLELIDRLHRGHLRNQIVTNIITWTADAAGGGNAVMENVQVAPTQAQLDNALINIGSSDNNCAICQDSITTAGARLRHCNHVFHRACLSNWFMVSVRCPVCRHDIRETQAGPAGQTSSVATGTTSLSVSPSAGH